MAFLKGKNYQMIMNATDDLAKEIKNLVEENKISQEELDKKVDEWHKKNGTLGEEEKFGVSSFARGTSGKSDWGKKNDNLYHGTYRGNKDKIISGGFKEDSDLFISNSIYDAEGYGDTIFELPLAILEKMNIIEVDDEKWSKNDPIEEGVDGYYHKRDDNEVINYRIKNVEKLNKIIKFLEDLKDGN